VGRACTIIEVMHGELTFPYRNPEQNPAPGRPRFDMAFTVTDDAPRVATAAGTAGAKDRTRAAAPGRTRRDPGVRRRWRTRTGAGEGLQPGKGYALNWTRVVGNRMTMAPNAGQPGRTRLGGGVQGDRREQG